MRTILRSFITASLLIACLISNFKAAAQISIPSAAPVTENFISMGATLNLPPNWKVSPAGNIPPTYAAGVTTVTQQASNGTSTTSGRYNWGTTPATDRAVGFMTDAGYASPNAVMAFYRNTSGSVITSLTVSFQVERYRVNTNTADISFSSSRDGVTWASQPGGDIPTGVFTTGTSDFLFALPTTITRTVTISGLSLANNADYYLRWVFTTGGGTGSQGLGLDDVSVTATTIGTTTVAATLADALTNDVNANTFADPGDKLTYTAVITNTGANPAANTTINPTAPTNTTLSGVAKTSALCVDDHFTNAQVPTANVLTNDFGLPFLTVVSFGPTATPGATTVVSGLNGSTNAGGSVTVMAGGKFFYTPPGGFTGLDQFAYVATTGTAPNDNAVVTIAVGGPNGVADAYSPSTNLSLTVAAPGVLANDGGTGITVTAVNGNGAVGAAIPTVKGGTVMVQANGGFTYNPPPGYTGYDEFTYTLTNAVGSSNAVVTLTMAGAALWFVNNNAASNGNGTLGSPFKLLSDFQAVNDGAATHPKNNDVIFLYESGTSYIGPVTLRSGQKLVGQDASTDLATIAGIAANASLPTMTPGSANSTTITSSGIGITLNTGNTVRGLTVGATTGAKISGSGFGTLTLGNNTTPDVILSGAGQTLNLTTGSFGTASGLISLASTSSTASGLNLTGVGGTLNFGSTTISGTTTQGIVVNGSTADLNFGNTTITAAADGVSLSSNSAGTRTFGTLTITVPGANNGFVYSNAGGTTTVTGATVINNSNTGTGVGINITGATAAITFAGVTVNKSGAGTAISLSNGSGGNSAGNVSFTSVILGTSGVRLTGQGINIAGVASNTPTYSFGAVSIFTSGATAFTANNFAGTINTTSGTVDALSATALNIIGPGPATLTTAGITLTTVNSTGGTNNIAISYCSGTINGGTGALSGASTPSFSLTGGTANITYAGTISQATASQLLVSIVSTVGGTVTLSGNLSSTGSSSNISVASTGNTTINFSGTTKTLSGTGNRGVTLTTNPTSQINFSNGGLAITNTTNTGFDATGGGIVTVTGANNTITTTSGIGLNIANTDASNVNPISFASITTATGPIANIIVSVGVKTLGRIQQTAANGSSAVTALSLNNAVTVNVGDALASTLKTTTGTGINNLSSTLNITGAGIDVTTTDNVTGGIGVNLSVGNIAAGSSGLRITTAKGIGVNMTSSGTSSISGTANTINSTTGTAINVNTGTANFTFQNVTSSAASTGAISYISNAGTTTISTGTITGTAGGAPVTVSGGSNNITYGGSITQGANAAMVSVTNGHTGTLTFNTGVLSATAGTGLQFDNADGTYNFNGTTTLNGGDAGIDIINNSGGNFSFLNAPITNPTGAAFLVNGGAGSINHAGTISKTSSGRLIDIQSRTGGSVSFSGNLSSTGGATGIIVNACSGGTVTLSGTTKTFNTGTNTPITLTSNAGATINFTNGGLDIDVSTATGFNATGGGTISITGSNNHITAGVGRAINIDGTTIGAAGITLQDVSASGSSTNTIHLKNAGSGGFTITGTGTTAGSGGTINHTSAGTTDETYSIATHAFTPNLFATGIGIYLNNVGNVSLSNMNFTGTFGNFAIRGETVNNFTLRESNFTGVYGTNGAGGVNEGTIRFGVQSDDGFGNGLTGTVFFTGNSIGGGFGDNIGIFNNTSGSMNMTVNDGTNPAVFNHNAFDGNDAILIETRGPANGATFGNPGGAAGAGFNLTLSINGVEFKGARGDNIQTVAATNCTQNITITNNTFFNTHPNIVSGGGGITLSGGGPTSNYIVSYNISNNQFKGAKGTPLQVNYSGQSATVNGIIVSNTIGTPNGTYNSASSQVGSSDNGNGINVTSEKFGDNVAGPPHSTGIINHAVRIQNNVVADINGLAGIRVSAGTQDQGGSLRVEATITGNTVSEMGPFGYAAFYAVVGGASLTTDFSKVGLNMMGNTFNAGGAGATGNGNAISFDQISVNARYYFPGYAGSQYGESTAPPGPGTASANLSTFLQDASHSNILTNGPFPNPAAGAGSKVDATLVVGVLGTAFVLPVPLMASGTTLPTNTVDNKNLLTELKIKRILKAAISRWAKAGATKEQLRAMLTVTIKIENIPGTFIGSSEKGIIKLDKDAGGYGWYFDQTPGDDAEFGKINTVHSTDIPKGKIDLLTVLLHELGHQIGLQDDYQPTESSNLMFGYLKPGERRLPLIQNQKKWSKKRYANKMISTLRQAEE